MREKAARILVLPAAIVMIYNLHTVFTRLPDEAMQGAVYRIIFVHVPAALVAYTFYTIALVCSVLFLKKKQFFYDSLSVSCIEVATMLILVNLVTGGIWGKSQWGIWWAWDLRLTTQLLCFLLYVGYLVVRPVIAEPTQRATMCSIIAIFAYADIPLVIMAIRLPNVRTQHPAAVIETGLTAPMFLAPLALGFLGLLLIGSALVLVRLHQENNWREADSLRRELHA